MITLYGIANCDTIRKTRKWLEQQGADYEFHDYKKLGCSSGLAKTLISELGIESVINKRGTTWRKLPESEREPLTATRAQKLMQDQPSLIKRPVLCVDDQWLVGYDTARITALISKGSK
jgi:Spx/MgsR family transcriptional regulator